MLFYDLGIFLTQSTIPRYWAARNFLPPFKSKFHRKLREMEMPRSPAELLLVDHTDDVLLNIASTLGAEDLLRLQLTHKCASD